MKIGWGEIVVIIIIALVVVGPDKLPELAHTLGKTLKSVTKFVKDTAEEMDIQEDINKVKTEIESIEKDVKDIGKSMEQSIKEPTKSEEPEKVKEEAPESEITDIAVDTEKEPEITETEGEVK